MTLKTDAPARSLSLADADPEIAQTVRNEERRQNDGLELIASENFVSRAVLEAAGSVLTNKYAEGYPGKRYYGGCEFVDVAETLAIDRAKALFGAEHANVQPHSGAQANMAVYFALLKPGDTVLGMNLAHGGHLTHGHPLNFSGKLYTIVPYGVRKDDERIDYDELARLADEHKPKMIMVGASAYPRIIDFARISEVAQRVGAPMVTDMAHIAGLVAAKQHPSPVPHSDFVTTTTHKTLRGPRAGHGAVPREIREGSRQGRVPWAAGRTADAHHRGQGGVLQGGGRTIVCRLSEADRRQRQAAGVGARRRRVPPCQRRHRQPSDARRCVLARPHGKSRGSGARQGRHHGQQERHPIRSEPADDGERHPPRHARRHHAGHGRARDGQDRRAHHARAGHTER